MSYLFGATCQVLFAPHSGVNYGGFVVNPVALCVLGGLCVWLFGVWSTVLVRRSRVVLGVCFVLTFGAADA